MSAIKRTVDDINVQYGYDGIDDNYYYQQYKQQQNEFN